LFAVFRNYIFDLLVDLLFAPLALVYVAALLLTLIGIIRGRTATDAGADSQRRLRTQRHKSFAPERRTRKIPG